jgi:alanine racemase
MQYRIHDIATFFSIELNSYREQLIDRVEIDSRHILIPERTFFVCLKGSHSDGHQYIPELVQKGVKLFLVSDPTYQTTDETCFILVQDVLQALQKFAAYHRSQFQIPIIGVTGSNGKTIVKEWLAAILSNKYLVCKNPKSYNSQIGVALAILELNENHELGIFEAGISTVKEMSSLQKMIQPTIGVFTSLGDAHQSGFISQEQKLEEKLSLFKDANSIVIHDNIDLGGLLQEKTFTIGELNDKKFQIINKSYHQSNTKIQILFESKLHEFIFPFIDQTSIENALIAVCTALLLEVETPFIQASLDGFHTLPMRLEVKEGLRQCTLINDSYSLDVKSLELAFRFLDQQNNLQSRSLVISDFPATEHDDNLFVILQNLISKYQIKKLVSIGSQIQKIQSFDSQEVTQFHFFTTEEFLSHLHLVKFQDEIILIKGARKFGLEKFVNEYSASQHDAFLEIDTKALENNFVKLKSTLQPETKIMAIVKAAAYGSGHYEIAQFLEKKQVDYFGVAYADEGILLRNKGIQTPIMVMNTGSCDFGLMSEHKLEPELYSLHQCRRIDKELSSSETLFVHLKIDTGMHRLGFLPQDVDSLIAWLIKKKNIVVRSIFSHLAGSDNARFDDFSAEQNERFKDISQRLIDAIGYKPMLHLLNSNGILRFQKKKEYQYDMVRFGIGMYGIGMENNILGLERVHSLKARVLQIKSLRTLDTVSYNQSGRLEQDGKIAILSIGYSDGIPRNLHLSQYKFFINGKYVPLIGVVCMDFCMVDISEAGQIEEGMEIEMFGKNADLQELSECCQTIPYEILTGISSRVKRVFAY